MSNIVFTGTREVDDDDFVLGALYYYGFNISDIKKIYVGCAKGVDKTVRRIADEKGIKKEVFKADWNGANKNIGGLLRNQEMLEAAKKEFSIFDCEVIGLPSAASRGTISCLVLAKEMGFRCYSYTYEFHKAYLERYTLERERCFNYRIDKK